MYFFYQNNYVDPATLGDEMLQDGDLMDDGIMQDEDMGVLNEDENRPGGDDDDMNGNPANNDDANNPDANGDMPGQDNPANQDQAGDQQADESQQQDETQADEEGSGGGGGTGGFFPTFSFPNFFRSFSRRQSRQLFSPCADRITLPCIVEDFIGAGMGTVQSCVPVICGNSLCQSRGDSCRIETSVTPFHIGVHFGDGKKHKGSPEDNIGACLRYKQLPCV